MRLLMMLFYLLLILLGVSFAALNASSVEVNLYFKTITMPISVLMTIMLGIGLLLGFLLFLYRYWRLKVAYLKIKSQLKLTEKEIKNLRAIPLKDQH
ncbi:lipopolysaccharide assembly protein LapA domain-containing protein [Legionella fairfieldensis]|uniref:lipopolysaccharide assembly protein LapA domain-containing protein n=1 Tax=Legionella fairfieldensis TaxID=45064 RepID=UPI000490D687|nr:LapA family protein [Legionella fairfieldensis]